MTVNDSTVLIVTMVVFLIHAIASFTYFLVVKSIWRYIKLTTCITSLYVVYMLYEAIWAGKSVIPAVVMALVVVGVTQLCGLFVSYTRATAEKTSNDKLINK